MSDFAIFIPTVGRVNRQLTAEALSNSGVNFRLVCPIEEKRLHDYPVVVCPRSAASKITTKRQWILENAGCNKIIMLDDDLKFKARRRDGGFEYSDRKQIRRMFDEIVHTLDDRAHVGLADDFMGHTRARDRVVVGRYNQVLAYNTDLFPSPWPRFRISGSEEHDVHLQLLSKGLRPVILTEWTKQSKNYTPGGISTFKPRDPKDELKAHRELEAMWPEFVKVVPNSRSLSGYSVRISWDLADKIFCRHETLI